MVRDALTMGPTRAEDRVTPHTRPPADSDGDHMLVRVLVCLEGSVEVELVCEPVFDYGRATPEWSLVDGGRHAADATSGDQTIRLQTDMAIGIEGDRVRARHTMQKGEQLFCSLSWAEGLESPKDVDEANARMAATVGLLARLARAGPARRPPLARAHPALRAGDQGAHLHADRRDGGRGNHVAARDARRRAELGLPLHMDARLHVHAPGAALAAARLGGRRVHAVRRRPRAQFGRGAPDHVRDRRQARPDRGDARRALGLRRRASGADRQRRLRPAPERRLRRGARLDPAPYARAASACRGGCGRSSRRRRSARPRSGATPTRGSGRPAGSRSTTCRRSSCAGWRSTARRSSRRSAASRRSRRPGARPRKRSRRTSSSTASATASCASTTTPTRSTRRRCWRRSSASCRATTSACASPSTRSRTT